MGALGIEPRASSLSETRSTTELCAHCSKLQNGRSKASSKFARSLAPAVPKARAKTELFYHATNNPARIQSLVKRPLKMFELFLPPPQYRLNLLSVAFLLHVLEESYLVLPQLHTSPPTQLERQSHLSKLPHQGCAL